MDNDTDEEKKLMTSHDSSQKLCAFVTGGSGYLGRNLIEYLVSNGWTVKALARSDHSAEVVKQRGAIAVKGDLNSVEIMKEQMKGCQACFHCAAFVSTWGNLNKALETTKIGTENVINAAKYAKVKRVIHVSTEQVLQRKKIAMVNVDETTPYPNNVFGVYGMTKKEAEIIAINANDSKNDFEVIVARPRWIWGKDDTKVLAEIIDKTQAGLLKWFDGGTYKTSTCHVTNVCYGLLLLYEKGIGGEIYFMTDGKDSVFKEFVSDLLICSGIEPPTSDISYSMMFCFAGCLECLCCCGKWDCCCCSCCKPPFNQADLVTAARECTVKDNKIRALGYQEIVMMKEGLLEIAKQNNIQMSRIENQLYCK
eukprot:238485_1